MEFRDVVLKRRMVRNFSTDPVDPAAITRILDLARHAPSAGFTQGQSFIVVTRPDLRQAIADICGEAQYVAGGFHPFISGAPVLLIPCTSEAAYHRRYQEPDKVQADGTEITWPVPYWHMDIGCAVMIVLLAAVDEGLAAGFAGARDTAALQAVLGIPDEVVPVGVIPLGHPAPDIPSPSLKRGRKAPAEFIHHEQWQSSGASTTT
ncbi:MAG: nitroreductase family protein [Chloroflexota bacterium]|nr:nitroreductase family protein [Chloroflexota bacterium]